LPLCQGPEFHILTDHKPLTFPLAIKSANLTPRQSRHLDYISQFTVYIRYTKGCDNVVTDALSCVEANALHTDMVIDLKAIAAAQQTDPTLIQFQSKCPSLKLQAM